MSQRRSERYLEIVVHCMRAFASEGDVAVVDATVVNLVRDGSITHKDSYLRCCDNVSATHQCLLRIQRSIFVD